MKSKLTHYLPMLAMTMIVGGCSAAHQMNPTPDQQGNSKLAQSEEDFNKERLIKEAHDKGVKEGIGRGFDKAKNIIINEYLPYIKRLEAGKYAMRKGNITPPEVMVYQSNDGTLSYKTTGCKIEKELNVDEIFKRFGESVVVKSESPAAQNKQGETISGSLNADSYFVSERDASVAAPARSAAPADIVFQTIEKTDANKLVLDQYNITYSEKDGNYVAVFNGEAEMNGFCDQFKICTKD